MRVKPRPDDHMYANSARSSMTGDHTAMRAWLLDRFLSEQEGPNPT